MAATRSLPEEFSDLQSFREGASYRRMDLHTHTPASECSSYRLPPELEAVFPAGKGAPGDRARYDFLVTLAGGDTSALEAAWAKVKAGLPARLGAEEALDACSISQIAAEWVDEIARQLGEVGAKLSPAQVRTRDDLVAVGLRDVSNYLMTLFFPYDYVLRCHLESLEIVALTDHNHPGYVVPRLPCLGTWYDAVTKVAEAFRADLQSSSGGAAVRAAIVANLAKAAGTVKQTVRDVSAAPEVKKNHEEQQEKTLGGVPDRKTHIAERAAYWACEANALKPLTVLRGVEITVSNVHVLAIFPPEWFVPLRIGAVLKGIGIPEEQWGCGFVAAASASVQDTVTLVDEAGGVAIPAHSNSDFKGLLRLFEKGLALTKVLEHPSLLALETTGGVVLKGAKKGQDKEAWQSLQWLEAGRGRPQRTKHLGFTKGSDAHECRIGCDGTGEDLGMRYTNVKLEIRPQDTIEETFRSVRLALMSGGDRLIEYPVEDGYNYRLKSEEARIPAAEREKLLGGGRPMVLGVTAHGSKSYADGLQVRFNPCLNCVIGSGGASTLVRLVGYAFGALPFMKGTPTDWLPELVRAFWSDGEGLHCVERTGRFVDPNQCETACYDLDSAGVWQPVSTNAATLAQFVQVWPSATIQTGNQRLNKFEDRVIQDLTTCLIGGPGSVNLPLLVNQPADLFNSDVLFDAVLGKPELKSRQIIWSTGSVNVPTALDAEKIIVTREIKKGKQMELVCAGDLHEDEIREVYLGHFEGGWAGFRRRLALYEA